jgi:hypothetical protein
MADLISPLFPRADVDDLVDMIDERRAKPTRKWRTRQRPRVQIAPEAFIEITSTSGANVQVAITRHGDGGSIHQQQSVYVLAGNAGTFTLTFVSGGSQTTAAIAWNASAAAVKSALDSLSNITSVTVMGLGTYASPWVVTMDDSTTDYSVMTATSSITPAIYAGFRVEEDTLPTIGTWVNRDAIFVKVPNSETLATGTRYRGSRQWLLPNDSLLYAPVVNAGATFSGARVKNSGAQSINSGSLTDVTFDSEDYDSDGYHSTSSATHKLIVPADGYYRVGFAGSWTSLGAPYDCQSYIYTNGSTINVFDVAPAATQGSTHNLETELHMSAGDYFSIKVAQQSGLGKNLSANGFWVSKIG